MSSTERQSVEPNAIGPNHARNLKNRRRIKRQRADARRIYEAVESGNAPERVVNAHLVRLLRAERKRSWAVGVEWQAQRELIRDAMEFVERAAIDHDDLAAYDVLRRMRIA